MSKVAKPTPEEITVSVMRYYLRAGESLGEVLEREISKRVFDRLGECLSLSELREAYREATSWACARLSEALAGLVEGQKSLEGTSME